MGVIRLGDILFLAFLMFVPCAFYLFIRFARRKGWIRYERLSWRDTENCIRRSRNTRRRAEKDR